MICTYKQMVESNWIGRILPLVEVPIGYWFTYIDPGWAMKGGRWARRSGCDGYIDEFFGITKSLRLHDWKLGNYLEYQGSLVKIVGKELPPECR